MSISTEAVTQDLLDSEMQVIADLLEIDPDCADSDGAMKDLVNQLAFRSKSLEIRNQIWDCSNCHLHKKCKKPVPFLGMEKRPEIVALGEAPGAEEDAANIGFVGRSGVLLRKSAEKVGIEIDDFINVCCCRPPDNREPTTIEINSCSVNLKDQIKHLDPWLVLTFGKTPLVAATMNKHLKVTRDHGIFFKTIWPSESSSLNHGGQARSIWGYSFYHPSYVLRALSGLKAIVDDDESRRRMKQNQETVQRWGQDWVFLAEIMKMRRLFKFSFESSFKDDLADVSKWEPAFDKIMDETKQSNSYPPGDDKKFNSRSPANPVGWGAGQEKTTYLQRMDNKIDFNMQEDDDWVVPF